MTKATHQVNRTSKGHDDQVFCLRGPGQTEVWRAVVNGRIVGAEWTNRGAALAGMQVEQRRDAARRAVQSIAGSSA